MTFIRFLNTFSHFTASIHEIKLVNQKLIFVNETILLGKAISILQDLVQY